MVVTFALRLYEVARQATSRLGLLAEAMLASLKTRWRRGRYPADMRSCRSALSQEQFNAGALCHERRNSSFSHSRAPFIPDILSAD
jgi:hypothetical protein